METDLVIVGTVALDNVKTPFGKVEDALGGSAAYASLASSLFSKTGVVAVVGEDYPDEYLEVLKEKDVDLEGIEKKGKTFRWHGFYEYDMNEAKTLRTELNSLETFDPVIPEHYSDAEFLFLANIDPDLQLKVLEQMKNTRFIAIDTMNFWIEHKKEQLLKVLSKVDAILINDGEARQLFDTTNLVKAAKMALDIGPKFVIIKKGEHGSLMVTKNGEFIAPSFPLETVQDPTGAGDSFAGGIMGYLAANGETIDEHVMRKAIMHGTIIASYNVQGFSADKLKTVTKEDIENRILNLKKMCEY